MSELRIALLVVLIIVVGLPVLDFLLGVLGVGSINLLARLAGTAKRMGYRASGRDFDSYYGDDDYDQFRSTNRRE